MAVSAPPRRTHAHDNSRRRAQHRRARAKWVWGGLIVFLIVAALVAFFSARSNTVETAAGVEQTRPVTIAGAPLPELGSGTDNAVGQLIPEVTGASFNGTPVSINHDGRPKLVLFVAHWCPHCQAEVPRVVTHVNQKALPAGLDLIAVSTAVDPAKPNYPPSTWLANEDWKWPTLADNDKGETALAYGLPGFPYFVAADASGKVVARTSGEISMDEFDALVQKAMTGSPG